MSDADGVKFSGPSQLKREPTAIERVLRRSIIETPSDLSALVHKFGGYHKIPPEAWREYDAAIEAYHARRGAGAALTTFGLAPAPRGNDRNGAKAREWTTWT